MSAFRRTDPVSVTPRLAAKAQQQRADRRHRWGKRSLLIAAVAGPLVLAGWALLATPLLAVRTVAVTGTERLTAAQVRAVVEVDRGTPLARVDTGAVAKRIRALRPVDSVAVTRSWPGTLRVTVRERAAVAGLVDRTGVVLVDREGVPFARAGALAPGTVRLQVPRPGPSDPTTRAALAVLAELPPSLRGPLRIVRAGSPVSVTLVLSGGRQVIWGGPEQTATKVQVTLALLKLPGRVYDVSRPTVVTRR